MFNINLASNAVDCNGHLEKLVSFDRDPFIASFQVFPGHISMGFYAKYSVVFMKDVDKGGHWIRLLKCIPFLCHAQGTKILPHAIQLFPLITVLKDILVFLLFPRPKFSECAQNIMKSTGSPFSMRFSIPLHQITSLWETKQGNWILAWVISERLLSSG